MKESGVFKALLKSAFFAGLQRSFKAATGLSLKLVPADTLLTSHVWSAADHPLCNSAEGPCTSVSCLKNISSPEQLADPKQPKRFSCCMGLVTIAVPNVRCGTTCAALIAGQVFNRKKTRANCEGFIKHVRDNRAVVDEKQLQSAYWKTLELSPEQIQGVEHLLIVCAAHINDFGLKYVIDPSAKDGTCVAKAKELVLRSLTGRVELNEAAQQVHLSKHYFCRLFKRTTGMTFADYVMCVRVERAKGLLLHPHARVNEIAYAVGFEAVSHFDHAFKRLAGVSPTEYRRSCGL